MVLDRDGRVVAASGGVGAATADDVATVFGLRRGAPIDPSVAFLSDGHRVQRRELPAGYLLLVVLPCGTDQRAPFELGDVTAPGSSIPEA